MPCTERHAPTGGGRANGGEPGAARLAPRLQRMAALLLLAGCTSKAPPPPLPEPPSAASAPPATTVTPAPAPLAAARRARDWDDFRLLAAERIVAANRAGTYDGPVPEPLLAIPVLEIELNADGSVRRITVLRPPRQARDTVELAIAAVHRAAPFGEVRHLPRPWKFAEVFLFDDERRFKPRTLDR